MSRPNFLIVFTAFLILASTLPITNAVDAQVRDFIVDNGIVIDSLDSTSVWTPNFYANLTLDTVNKVEGSASVRLSATGTAYIEKSISQDFSTARAFSIWVKCEDVSKVWKVSVRFSSTSNFAKYYNIDIFARGGIEYDTPELTAGWMHLVFDKASFSNIGAESWSNLMTKVRLYVHPSSGSPVVNFDGFTYDLEAKAKCVITFDDGRLSDYLYAKPILDSNIQRAVSYVIPQAVVLPWSDYMTTNQLNDLYNSGWDVGNHGYYHHRLDRLSASNLEIEVNGAYNWLVSKGYTRSAPFYAYAYGRGYDNQTVLSKVAENHIFARTIQYGWYQSLLSSSVSDPWLRLRCIEPYGLATTAHPRTTVQDVEAQIDSAINERGLLIIAFHQLHPSVASEYEWLVSDFEAVSDYLASKSDMIDVVTLSDLLQYNRPSVLQVYEDQVGFWLSSSGGSGSIGVVDGIETGDVHSGVSSTRFQVVAGSNAYVILSHNYPVWQDWSTYDALTFWWRGGGSGAVLEVSIYGPDWGNRYTAHFTDDFVGWRKVVLPRSVFTSTGSPSWGRVDAIQIASTSTTPVTWLLDAATMEPTDKTLTVIVSGSGVVTKTPDYSGYATDQVVTLSATSDAGWAFSGWSGDITGTTNPVTITMDASKTITSTFTRLTSAITFTSSGISGDTTGTILTIDGTPYTKAQLPQSFTWDQGSTHSVVATDPSTAGTGKQYTGISWINGDGLVGATGIYTVPVSSQTVTANYKTQFYLTVNDGGHGSPGGAGWKDADTNAQATMTPLTVPGSAGVQYVFTGWSGDASGAGSPSNNILMNGPKTATASWKTQYQVSYLVSPINSGLTTPSGVNVWVDAGELAVTVNPNPGYAFTRWESDNASITFDNTLSASTDSTIGGSGTIGAIMISVPIIDTLSLYSNNSYIVDGGDIERGQVLSIISDVSDLGFSSSELTVSISYRSNGDPWVSPTTIYNVTHDYWYILWAIPVDARVESYDVRVEASNFDGGSVERVDYDKFLVSNQHKLSEIPSPFIFDGSVDTRFVVGETGFHSASGLGAYTVDVYSALFVANALNPTSNGVLGSIIDTWISSYDDVEGTVAITDTTSNLIAVGGPAVNLVTYYYATDYEKAFSGARTPLAPVYLHKEWKSDSSEVRTWIRFPGGPDTYSDWDIVDGESDYSVIEMVYDDVNNRYVLTVFGLTGQGTEIGCKVLADYLGDRSLPFDLYGQAVLLRWDDVNGDQRAQLDEVTFVDAYVDEAALIIDPDLNLNNLPGPFFAEDGFIDASFVVGETGLHGAFGLGAYTVDVYSALYFAYALNISVNGAIESSIDTWISSYDDGSGYVSVTDTTSNLIAIGGPSVNMLTYQYATDYVRAFSGDRVPLSSVYLHKEWSSNPADIRTWIRFPGQPDTYSDWDIVDGTSDYSIIEIVEDPVNNRIILVVFGLTGQGTEAGCKILAAYLRGDSLPFVFSGDAMLLRWDDGNGDQRAQIEEVTMVRKYP